MSTAKSPDTAPALAAPRSKNTHRRPPIVRTLRAPVGKDSVVSLVIDRIKDALLRKELKPGDCLPSETERTRNLGVSKSGVREAVKMLQAMGLVEVRRGQGTLIRQQPGPDGISPLLFQLIVENGYSADLVELRLMFEPAFSIMAMERASAEDRDRIRAAMERLESAVRSGSQAAEDDIAFHLAILQTTKNPLAVRIGETIFQLFTPSISISMAHIAARGPMTLGLLGSWASTTLRLAQVPDRQIAKLPARRLDKLPGIR